MESDRRETQRTTVYRAEMPGPEPTVWEAEYTAVADALHFACRDLREGRRRPLEITEDGVRVLGAEEIAAECRRLYDVGHPHA